MIFTGPAGTGKTSAALALLREIYGDKVSSCTKVYNASFYRSIDDVREEFSDFISSGSSEDVLQKALVLEEAEQMTPEAQKAFKKEIEDWEFNCAVVFITNDLRDIIEPIVSRSPVYEFLPLPIAKTVEAVKKICNAEKLEVPDAVVDAVCHKYRGDMRRILNDAIEKFSLLGRPITMNDVRSLMTPARLGSEIVDMIQNGSKATEVIKHFEKTVKDDPTIKTRDVIKEAAGFARKAENFNLLLALADADYRIVVGGDDILQFDMFIIKATEEN